MNAQLRIAHHAALNTHPAVQATIIRKGGPKVEILRKGGKGIEGTVFNADHHAKPMLAFVDAIAPKVLEMDFALWRQGHNIHSFHTHDGREFDMVPLRKSGYVGVRLRLRVSRSNKVTMCDCISLGKVPSLLATMRMLFAEPSDAEVGGGIADSCE